MNKRKFVHISKIALILTSILFVLAACSDGGKQKVTGRALLSAPKDVVSVYRNNCISCHGTDLQGRIGPGTNLQKIGARLSKEEISDTIANGVIDANGGYSMKPHKDKLTAEEMDRLSEWLSKKK
ncbi:c-type cytochrome [Paenibacillus yanchengensis]|uniref:C-type cytochrome n=1 Tax=Paenibacillus yanchengensis TaxID=2035833 RepID=A0ABW4YIB5_9BACL